MTTDHIRRKLAQQLAEARGLNNSPEKKLTQNNTTIARTIPRAPNHGPLPLSNAQERMWFLHKLDPAASAYNVCVLWHLHGNLNVIALQKSAERITHRHSIFRTIYHTDEQGRAQQRILPHQPPEWKFEDLRDLLPREHRENIAEIAQQAATSPFDLSCRTPLRLTLIALTDVHHVLVMVGQHIVWDGPSFGIFSRELADGYNLFCNNQTDHYPQPPAQYIDFAQWHRQQWQAASAARSDELAFWQTQLDPLPEPLDFPTDFERNLGGDEAGNWCAESLDASATAALLQLAGQEKLTPFELVIAAIALLMTRLSRSSEVTIGTVASHRNLPELNGVIGNFGNVVPLRLTIAGHWSFRKLLQHCAAQCRAAFSHADLPFEYLLDHLNIPRGETRSPLLDTMVTFLSHGMEAPAMQGLDIHWRKHFNGTSQIDLSFDALLSDGCLQLQATWRSSLYRPDTVPKHLRRLVRLLRECVAAPDAPLTERSLLLSEEYAELTQSWGARPAQPADADTLVGWFERTVRKHSEAIALNTSLHDREPNEKSGLSFAVLNARANTLARWLVAQGIGPENRVAIALPRKPEWFVAMLATLKAGAAFVPIDPAYPTDYINRVVSLAQPTLRFIDSAIELDLPGISVSLEEAEKAAQQAGFTSHDLTDAERRQPLRAGHPVCVIFTSGSSGKPKGVVVSHSALVNLLSSHRQDLYKEAARLTGRQLFRVGHAWSFAFDASWQPALWMFDGHELHVFDVEIMRDPVALAREIIQRKLDFIELTPGLLDEVLPWLQSGLTEPGGKHLPGHVPAILGFGGESVKAALWDRLLKLEGTTGFNLYGPTEACVDTMIARASAEQPPNIGRPVSGAQVYVLDACLQLSPPGVAGELAIAGEGLARGYLTRGDLTATQFIANPHGAPGSRLYRTGDRVRWLPGGIMEYIGRIDEQVKIRGFRVEPLEVEATVEKIVQRPCAVVARQGKSGTVQLLCFIEPGTAEDIIATDPDALLQLCAAALPAHLVPKHIIPMQRLPRLPNGKIDRRGLVMPADMESAPGRKARTSLEQQLCRLMAEVLGLAEVNIDDGFFELGGDSISVIKLVSLARRDGITLTARQIFDTRSVARLASLLSNGKTGLIGKPLLKHDDADTGLARATPLMARYLALGQPLRRFAQIVSLPLPSAIHQQELNALLEALLHRHAMLRARLVTPPGDIPYLEIPAEALSEKIQATLTHSADHADIARQLCEQLDPTKGVMVAAALVHDAQHHAQVLWLAISHLVIDASSWHILAGDLALGRALQEQGKSLELPPVATAWRRWSAVSTQATAVTNSPVQRGNLAGATRKSWTLAQRQGQCLAAAAARRLGLPLASLLPALTALAANQAGLVPSDQNRTISLIVERHGREPSHTDQDLSRTIGWFAKELSVRLQAPEYFRPTVSGKNLIALVQRWCGAIAQLDEAGPEGGNSFLPATESQPLNDWQLGFNFLGDFAIADKNAMWTPQPQMELLVEACGKDWPLLHDLDISAHYIQQNDCRALRFDALAASPRVDEAVLKRLFQELEKLLVTLSGTDVTGHQNRHYLSAKAIELKEVTPLQYTMLQQSIGESDPWTTQMEIVLEATSEQPLSVQSLQQSATRLLSRHQALRAGFLSDSAATFIPHYLKPDWQSLDLSGQTAESQHTQLTQIRQQWYQHRFQLEQPPLVRFMALRLGEYQWRLLINCHHLLLDGWSVPRVLQEWLGGACGPAAQDEPLLPWTNYLDWLQTEDRSLAWRYWNRTLQGLQAPSLLYPNRTKRTPSEDLQDAFSSEQSKAVADSVRRAGISSAALYQLAWAKTLADELRQSDIVFGLFDSGRSAPLEGLTALVGLVTQLVPLRIDTDSPLTVSEQLRELQARQFEWQAQMPVRMDNLDIANRFGEFFDTLLVIENALDADAKMESSKTSSPITPLSMIREQSWRDSIGQTVGLFIYPQHPIELRLCYDPLCVERGMAQHLLAAFKHQIAQLIQNLASDPETAVNAALSPIASSHHNQPLIPAETDNE